MENTEKKVVIDSNWYISFLIKKSDSRLNAVLLNYDVELIISNDLINELKNTIQEERFRKYFPIPDAMLFIERLQQKAIFVNVTAPLQEWCRDVKDNYLLALSKDSDADYLITGDKDLLVLKQFENTLIITLSQFLEIINALS
ncbi:MAG TPA: putative toxin-antitoxin system toxin component, PIN family [Parafilimonas sp.]|nr:putative toxin-antitoxin system toxin component, PIN family [Parafilimonas sp.]